MKFSRKNLDAGDLTEYADEQTTKITKQLTKSVVGKVAKVIKMALRSGRYSGDAN